MQSQVEAPQLCWLCGKEAAIRKYTRGNISEMLCQPCLDRMAVRDAIDDNILHIHNLMEKGRYDEAFAVLDAIWEANRHLDHEKQLARSIASTREFILWDAGRYAEALEACEAVAQFGFKNVADRWSLGSAKAKNLQALGRHEEALTAFEEAFSHQDPRLADGAAYYLPVLAELYEGVGRPVDEKWREVALMVAEEYGIKMPVRKTLAKSLRVLNKLTGRMKTKRQKEWEKKNQGKADDP